MQNQQNVIDAGLVDTLQGYTLFTLDEPFGTTTTLFRTLKEFREYNQPGTESWGNYILDIFHLLGFQTHKIGPGHYGLTLMGMTSLFFPITLFIQTVEKNSTVSKSTKNGLTWGIITDGLQFKFYNLSRAVRGNPYLWANLENILSNDQLDSFFTIYKLIAFMRHSIRKSPENDLFSANFTDINGEDIAFYKYAQLFATIKTSIHYTLWTVATKFRAPHKPLLLLAVLDYLTQGKYGNDLIEIEPDLIERFDHYWLTTLPGSGRPGKIIYPFFYLKTSGFWHLVPVAGQEQVLADTREISAISHLKRLVSGARLDEDLNYLVQDRRHRDRFRDVLLSTYFDQNTGERIRSTFFDR